MGWWEWRGEYSMLCFYYRIERKCPQGEYYRKIMGVEWWLI
jgi:hypothetical protein